VWRTLDKTALVGPGSPNRIGLMTEDASNNFSPPVAGVPGGLLAGRIAVIRGAGTGIGAATAHRFAAAGAAAALLGRRSGLLDDLAATLRKEHSAEVLPLAVDVSDPAALTTAASTIRATLGRPDLVVATAGVMLGAPFDEADTAEWDQMIDVNLRGLLATGRVFIADLLDAAEAGRAADLVNLGSIAAEVIFADYPVYGATKAHESGQAVFEATIVADLKNATSRYPSVTGLDEPTALTSRA
jgi:NADP-dependent 3-hydroxy acid dehydrogenase YdfG